MRMKSDRQTVEDCIDDLKQSILLNINSLQYWCVINKFASEKRTDPYYIQKELIDKNLNSLVLELCKENSDESYFYLTSQGYVCLYGTENSHLTFDEFLVELKKYESYLSGDTPF